MLLLTLCNTLTGKSEAFKPAENLLVKMYTCGPSTYQRAHIGNYRTFLFEDILQRYLEYLGYKVIRLITLTDIEDKAIAEAKKENVSVEDLTNRNEATFFKEFECLRIKRPDFTVRASAIVNQSVYLIKALMGKAVAYKYTFEGAENIYYDPRKFSEFGKLAHLNMKLWPKTKRRFHQDTYHGTPWNKGDFILWHGCKTGETVCWDTDVGRGRPAWNIQDAAMVTKHLGFTVDVACGGIDNLVRHHDYTLAVAEAVSGKEFARFWLHGAHLFVDGKKMSKSIGNVIYPDDLTAKGYRGDHIRFFLIYGHYRKRKNFTLKKFAQTSKKIDELKDMVKELQAAKSTKPNPKAKTLVENIIPRFEEHMNGDLDVKTAFDTLYQTVAKLQSFARKGELSAELARATVDGLRKVDSVLQLVF
jgi:cysteinyl-tRNA synthetase